MNEETIRVESERIYTWYPHEAPTEQLESAAPSFFKHAEINESVAECKQRNEEAQYRQWKYGQKGALVPNKELIVVDKKWMGA